MTLPALCRLARPAVLAAAASLVPLAHAQEARACACCAEPGQRIETTAPLEPYEKTELSRLRFDKTARLYLNAAGFDGVSGISDPSEAYEVAVARQGDRWTFAFKDARGNAGTLAWSLPTTLEAFFVDPHDGQQSGAGGPLLFKEWRLTAPVSVAGVFALGAAGGPTVRLILQGRGNACTSADQFHAWTLVVSGPKARYTLYGTLAAPASAP